MRKAVIVFFLLVAPVIAQEEIFGYEIIDELLEPAVTSYIGREVWAYGNLDVYCQKRVDIPQSTRFYNTTPELKLSIDTIELVKLPENFWQQIIHVNGGFTQPGDYSGVSSETAFLIVLKTETAIKNNGYASNGTFLEDELCQDFFTIVFPEMMYLERIFSFESIQDVAKEKVWPKQALNNVLDMNVSVQIGMTKDMVLWKLGAPLRPLELKESFDADAWSYLSQVPFSKDVTFDKRDGNVIKFIEGRLP
jgi:hypothetical protein